MFNSYLAVFPPFVPRTHEEIPTLSIAEVIIPFGDSIVVKPASDVVLIEPRLKFRSVTPSEQQKNGIAKPISGNGFLQPSLSDVERVSAVLAAIDDKFSYEAALEKFAAQVNSSHEPTNEQTKELTEEPINEPKTE